MNTKIINVKENENLFTSEQLKAIEKAHDSIFYASMCDQYSKEVAETEAAKRELKKAIPNMVDFFPNYYGNGDKIEIKI
jgi:hypothetical protein